jgi:hypothetical protein
VDDQKLLINCCGEVRLKRFKRGEREKGEWEKGRLRD